MSAMQVAGDAEIRAALHSHLAELHPGALRVDELETGLSRIDIAVINENLTGIEIKSARDSVRRLEQQAVDYSQVCTFALVVGPTCKLKAAAKIVPDWWGLLDVEQTGGGLVFHPARAIEPNPAINVRRLAFLLWKPELLALAAKYDMLRGNRSKAKVQLATLQRLPPLSLQSHEAETREAAIGQKEAGSKAVKTPARWADGPTAARRCDSGRARRLTLSLALAVRPMRSAPRCASSARPRRSRSSRICSTARSRSRCSASATRAATISQSTKS
jgi:hypothetical protein